MSENKKYTIIVKKQRVEVSEAVYRAYHKEREAERYQNKLIRQNELSLERFHEDGVNIDYLIVCVQADIVWTSSFIRSSWSRCGQRYSTCRRMSAASLMNCFSTRKASVSWLQSLVFLA